MKIAVLGTGMVGRAVAARLAELGHDVVVGTRDVEATLGRTEPDGMGNPPYAQWLHEHPDVRVAALADAGAHGEVIVNATSGQASQAALEGAGAGQLAGRVILDLANPLDFSQGMPPVLSVANTDSLAERLQAAFPDARLVKALNTMNAYVMVDPARLSGPHNVFIAGDDADAKEAVKGLLRAFGWPDEAIVDLGGIRAARGMEMFLPLWLSLYRALGTGAFNIGIVRA